MAPCDSQCMELDREPPLVITIALPFLLVALLDLGTWARPSIPRRALLLHMTVGRKELRLCLAWAAQGVGDPPNVNDTSNFSLFVLEQRRLDAQRCKHNYASHAQSFFRLSFRARCSLSPHPWACCLVSCKLRCVRHPTGRRAAAARKRRGSVGTGSQPLLLSEQPFEPPYLMCCGGEG